MTSTSWSKLGIKEVESDKLYFKKYHYKLEINVLLATYLRDKKSKLTHQHVKDYISRYRNINYNYGGAWGYYRHYHETIMHSRTDDIVQVISIGEILRATENIKYTVEQKSIRIYSDSEDQLLDITKQIEAKTGPVSYRACVFKPTSATVDAMDAGYEILSKDPGFSHKVILRDRMIGHATKVQILNYLISLGDEVKISSGVQRMLSSKGNYMYAGWFRTNDTSLVSFLELIAPGIVRKIVPVYVKNK